MLKALHAFETGPTLPITHGPNRGIGVPGSYAVAVNLAEKNPVPAAGWLTSEG